jgi:hypothetical protein
VFYQEDGEWVAHGLQFDLLGVGATKSQAMEVLLAAIETQICESLKTGNLKNLFTPANGEYFRMFAAGEDVADSELSVSLPQSPGARVVIERTESRVFERESHHRSNRDDLVSV